MIHCQTVMYSILQLSILLQMYTFHFIYIHFIIYINRLKLLDDGSDIFHCKTERFE